MCWIEPFLSLSPLGPLLSALWQQPPPAHMGLRAAVLTCAFPQRYPVSLSRRLVAVLRALVVHAAAPATHGAGPRSGLFSLKAGTTGLSRSRSKSESCGDKSGSNWGKSLGPWACPWLTLVAHFLD